LSASKLYRVDANDLALTGLEVDEVSKRGTDAPHVVNFVQTTPNGDTLVALRKSAATNTLKVPDVFLLDTKTRVWTWIPFAATQGEVVGAKIGNEQFSIAPRSNTEFDLRLAANEYVRLKVDSASSTPTIIVENKNLDAADFEESKKQVGAKVEDKGSSSTPSATVSKTGARVTPVPLAYPQGLHDSSYAQAIYNMTQEGLPVAPDLVKAITYGVFNNVSLVLVSHFYDGEKRRSWFVFNEKEFKWVGPVMYDVGQSASKIPFYFVAFPNVAYITFNASLYEVVPTNDDAVVKLNKIACPLPDTLYSKGVKAVANVKKGRVYFVGWNDQEATIFAYVPANNEWGKIDVDLVGYPNGLRTLPPPALGKRFHEVVFTVQNRLLWYIPDPALPFAVTDLGFMTYASVLAAQEKRGTPTEDDYPVVADKTARQQRLDRILSSNITVTDAHVQTLTASALQELKVNKDALNQILSEEGITIGTHVRLGSISAKEVQVLGISTPDMTDDEKLLIRTVSDDLSRLDDRQRAYNQDLEVAQTNTAWAEKNLQTQQEILRVRKIDLDYKRRLLEIVERMMDYVAGWKRTYGE
jgi:hypothetical protein